VATRGRPPVLDEAKQREITALLTVGCSHRLAAEYVGCARSTIERTAQRNPLFAAKLRQAKTNTEIGFFKSLQKASKKEQYWRAAAWALERMAPERFALRDPAVISVEQIVRLLSQLADIVVEEVPHPHYRKNVLKRFDALKRTLSDASPERLREDRNPKPHRDQSSKKVDARVSQVHDDQPRP
jgi:IS30 family transposase